MKRLLQVTALILALLVATGAGAGQKKAKKVSNGATETYTDAATGMQFVWVRGGCYMMGDTFNYKDAAKNEQPVHEVCLDGFYMGKYEVTQGEWTEIMGSNPSEFFGERNPVEQVSWDDAQSFIAKLNARSGKRYRLPTEAEWEFAARSGGKKELWAGTSNEKELTNYAWYNVNSGNTTHPVGQKRPNGLGLYDMSGNVWEWCSDWYSNSGYDDDAIKDKPRNPQGPSTGSGRVLRGGSWRDSAGSTRASDRRINSLGARRNYLGFRLVLPPVQ